MTDSPVVLDLSDPAALDAALSGAKAANIARAAVAGLATLPGFVLTTAGVELRDDPAAGEALLDAWRAVGGPSGTPLVVRSSSTIEDAGQSSMAGQFTSVLDVQDEVAFRAAVDRVIASAERVRGDAAEPQPMAVLVQQQLDAAYGGVLFSVDPVTGDAKHLMVEVVPSRPDTLVGGSVTAAHYVLSRRGRVVEGQRTEAAPRLPRRVRRELVQLARRAEDAFGIPQDIEWAVDRQDRLWLLQSRPITAVGDRSRGGPVMGPGPVAETFPEPLRQLEVDTLLQPLRAGISRALLMTGAVSAKRIEASPVVTTVGGWAAADLDLLGVNRSQVRKRLDPAWIGRRLVSAWRVGRLRVALPATAKSLIGAVDDDLSGVGPLAPRADRELLELLDRAQRELTTVHTYEVLAGMLLRSTGDAVPAGVVALGALQRGRVQGLDDREIVATYPVVLALSAPAIVAEAGLPEVPTSGTVTHGDVDDLDTRDALRLRARWLQELVVRIVQVLGERLADAGRLPDARLVADLRRDELDALVHTGVAPDDLESRANAPVGPPLPNMFRLQRSGAVRPVRPRRERGRATATGIAAGGGRGAGTVVHHVTIEASAARARRGGVVLVTRHLEPQLAPLLPMLAGLVSETGSALSHLAILAREMHVPTVVGVTDARHRFPAGAEIVVDGDEGSVDLLHEAGSDEAQPSEAAT